MKFNQYWFKPKLYGDGAAPSTWEGWLVTLGFIAFIVYVASRLPNNNSRFYIIAVFTVVLFVIFVKKKTDGGWKWNWGKKKEPQINQKDN